MMMVLSVHIYDFFPPRNTATTKQKEIFSFMACKYFLFETEKDVKGGTSRSIPDERDTRVVRVINSTPSPPL